MKITVCQQIYRFLLIWLLAITAHATPVTNQFQAQYDQDIQTILQKLEHQHFNTYGEKIDFISQQFLGKPYLLFALGEGGNNLFNQRPLYRSDFFDCETLVDTTLAIARSKNFSDFKRHIIAIRYQKDMPSFLGRNHFISLDWNKNNQSKGYIKDITQTIQSRGQTITKTAIAFIDKPNWYQHLSKNRIYLPEATPTKIDEQLQKLKAMGVLTQAQHSKIDYLPTSIFFNAQGDAQLELFKQIPNGSILEIVRPNWELKKEIGTNLHVSHLGFVIWKDHKVYFRNASSLHQKVEDESLIDYLRKTLDSKTIKGIHLELPLP